MTYRYIEEMRGRLGLEKDDTSRDKDIAAMTPHGRLELICGWTLGYSDWSDRFLSWAEDAGFKISPKRGNG